jgi:hypothetical protein
VEIFGWNNDVTGQQEGCRVVIAGRNLSFLTKTMFYLFLEVGKGKHRKMCTELGCMYNTWCRSHMLPYP